MIRSRLCMPALCAGLLMLAGCSDGSNESTDPASDSPQQDEPRDEPPDVAPDGSILGSVSAFSGNTPLADVQVILRPDDDATAIASTASDAQGGYRFDSVPRGRLYDITFAAPGYREEIYSSILFATDSEVELEPVRLVSNDNAGEGGLTGTIRNAVDGLPIEGVSLSFRAGINAREGDVVATATTDANGAYGVSGLPYGNVTCVVVGEGLQTVYTTIQIIGNVSRDQQNVAISPRVGEGDTRIVLTWGQDPRDMDSHLTGPGVDGGQPFHLYFGQARLDGAVLDVDDRDSFGPETITVDPSRDGVYRYSVHRYSPGTASSLSESGARVQVLQAEGTVAEFFVPRGVGDIWSVFDLVGGEILPVNTLIEQQSEDDWYAPETNLLR